MATPAREQVLDEVAVQLAKIDGTNLYKTTLSTASPEYPTGVWRELVDWGMVGKTEFPMVCYAPASVTSTTYRPGNCIDVTMPIVIIGHVNALKGAAKTAAVSNLEDDVIAAMHSTSNLGGTAISAKWTGGSYTDEGNPESNDSRGGSGTLVMFWEIKYQRRATHS